MSGPRRSRHGLARLGGWLADAAMVTFGYAYVGYPLTVLARASLAPKDHATGPPTGRVSVVIAAHNEAGVIREKLESVLAARPTGTEIEVVVADDGSTDPTPALAEEVAAVADVPVSVLRLPRSGKAAALEAAVGEAAGEILVFTDANSIVTEGTLARLVAPFADPSVGGVVGDQRYEDESGALGERLHWAFDRRLKRAESACGSTVSATGALYAIRREHFAGVPADVTDDFYISTGVVSDGKRLVFAADATVTEPAAATMSNEYARKVRVMTRGLRGVLVRRDLLSRRQGFYALAFASRKVVRRLVGPVLIVGAIGSVLARRGRLRHRLVASGSVTVAALGAAGLVAPDAARQHWWLGLPSFACASVAASTHAFVNVVTGVRITRWDRPESSAHDSP